MRAAVFHGAGDIRLEQVPDPSCGPDDVVIRVEACGICGTDVHAYRHGPTAFAQPGQILGHEFAGTVVEVGTNIPDVAVGDRVTAWPIVHCDQCATCLNGNWHLCTNALGHSVSSGLPGAFAEFVRIPRARPRRTLYHLPPGLGPLEGALVEPMSVALRAAGFTSIRPAETVLVTGLGPIGLCVIQALRLAPGMRTIGVDLSARRRQAATNLGTDALDPDDGPLTDQLRDILAPGESIDAVCECSGSADALAQGLEAVKPGGRIVLAGLYGEAPRLAIDPILTKEIRVQGTYAYRTEYEQTISLFAARRLQPEALVSHQLPLAQIANAFALQSDPRQAVKVLVIP